MNDIKVFNNPQFGKIRMVICDGEPRFVGKDVAVALGYINPRKALADHVADEDKNTVTIRDGIQGNPNMTVINESGVYSLILSSKLPTAQAFKHWVTSDILPSIHKHGAYLTPETIEKVLCDPDTIIKLATALKEERARRVALENKVEADEPKVLFAKAVSAAKTSILIGDMAKLLKQNGIEIGQRRLFEWLRKHGYLIKRNGADWNMPTQRAMEMEMFEIKETAITHADGHTSINRTTKVTVDILPTAKAGGFWAQTGSA